MRTATLKVFDDIISGTGPWYTGTDFNQRIGSGDEFIVQAVTTGKDGTPTLTVGAEHSPDSEHWVDDVVDNPPIDDGNVTEDGSLAGSPVLNPAPNVRLKITMGGGSPKCRLQLYVTVRSFAMPWRSPR